MGAMANSVISRKHTRPSRGQMATLVNPDNCLALVGNNVYFISRGRPDLLESADLACRLKIAYEVGVDSARFGGWVRGDNG